LISFSTLREKEISPTAIKETLGGGVGVEWGINKGGLKNLKFAWRRKKIDKNIPVKKIAIIPKILNFIFLKKVYNIKKGGSNERLYFLQNC
jgi:hypothetical protein